jgi:PKD repeat protein
MNQYLIRTLTTVLYLYACCIVLVLAVTAAPVTTTTAIPHASCDFPQTPHAGFSLVTTDDVPPLTYQFTDTSTSISGQPITSYKWTFSEGGSSTEKNPQHTYAASYTKQNLGVTLTVTTVCGKSDTTQTTFKVQCTRPDAGFTTNVSGGFAPLSVKVTGTSQHTPASVTRWIYELTSDNGMSGYSSSANPDTAYVLLNAGNYTITQKVTKDCNINSDTFSKNIRASSLQLMYIVTTSATTPATTATTMVTTATSTTQPVTSTTVPVSTEITTATGTVPATIPGETTMAAPSAAAQTAQAAPGTGTLSVITTPPGAHVYVDEVLRGASPANIPGLSAGSHTIRLVLAGYQTMTVPVDINDGRTTGYSTALVPESGSSTGILPLIPGIIVVLAIVGAGAYFFIKKKRLQ